MRPRLREDPGTPALVSIVIPTYNDDPQHLQESVASARGQTYPHVEVVVVDDGLTAPASRAALKALEGVTLIRQENAGVAAARNTGVRAARGDFILPLDADDRLDLHLIEEAVAVLKAGAVIARPAVSRFGAADGEEPGRAGALGFDDALAETPAPQASLFRRRRWEAIGGWDESLDRGYEDWEFWVRVLRGGGRAVRLPTARLHYRIRPSSRFRSTDGHEAVRLTRAAIRRNSPWWVFVGVRMTAARARRRWGRWR